MLEILEKAKMATQCNDWLQVNDCLQQLPLAKDKQMPFDDEALDLALTVLNCGDFRERWEIAKILPKFGDRAIPPLIAILEDEEIEIEERWFAGRILGQFDRPLVIDALVRCWQTSEDEELTAIVAAALANLGESAIAPLANLLERPELRPLATQALAQIRHPVAIDCLLSVVRDRDAWVRATVVEALGTIRDRRLIPVLIEALNDINSNVRKEAAIALGLWRDLSSELDLLTVLTPRLYDFNLEVCQQAAMAIGKLKTPEAATTLFHVFQSPATPLVLQIHLIRALAWNETEAGLECLQKILGLAGEKGVLETIRVLGRVESSHLKPLASRILLDFFSRQSFPLESMEILQSLIQAWGQLGDSEAVAVLIPLKEHHTAIVRLHAIAALQNCQVSV
ncbi:MAG: HEAT repeat domain-containing protein [Cyanobacteria bacterium SBLK]|nr:HEAT repeat domain-containing protein [Cyanobacteria bacterium SBLK]